MAARTVFRVTFHNRGKVYELHVARVNPSNLLGFVEVEDFLFGEKTSLVVDPAEEQLKSEFEGVRRALIPLHAVVRIDEVEARGANKILPGGGEGNVTPFPTTFVPSTGKDPR
jgi:hypothetical protein